MIKNMSMVGLVPPPNTNSKNDIINYLK